MMRRKKNESVMRLANQNSSNSKRLFPVIRTWGTLNRFSFCTGVTEPTQTRKFPALWGVALFMAAQALWLQHQLLQSRRHFCRL